jgi:repressor LexA
MGKHGKNLRSEVLEFMESFVDDNGYPPTFEEIMEAVGLSSKSHVDYYLVALEEAGAIERTPRTPRGLRLVRREPDRFEVRVEGRIAAGQPIELAHEPDHEIELTADIADPRKDLYALEVRGDSMVDQLVGDGDILVVERKRVADKGQMAVVHLKDSNAATLKRVYPEGERVRLQPAHPTLPPIYVDARDVEIQGRIVAIIRRL